MPNSYFRFKEFTIEQDACAMKVCTDSCLFGAWTADHFSKEKKETKSILDIGSGTGLLSLMLIQKLPSAVADAIEIETVCFVQSQHNIHCSPWRENIQLYNADIMTFMPQKQYDVIICNPPFFESDLPSTNAKKNIAHHNAGLTLQDLISAVKINLSQDGHFAVLLPYSRATEFEKAMNPECFFINKKTLVRQSGNHSFFRAMLLFSKEKKEVLEEEIIIKESNDEYSAEFISLLKDYYLHF